MTTTFFETAPAYAGFASKLLQPAWAEVTKFTPEAEGINTIAIRFTDPDLRQNFRWKPGQFNMLYIPGFGESAISMSSDVESGDGQVIHTIRSAGSATKAMSRLRIGDIVGVRGPFGTSWPLKAIEGMDIIIGCGGIGLPPLRGAIQTIVRERSKYGKVILLYGARSPKDLMYPTEYETWQNAGIDLQITVDRGDETWNGRVGVAPMMFYNIRLDPKKSAVLACGPEIMMRFVIYEALARRIPADHIFVSMERNMKCGQGACGHCQMGPYFICKDGPVFPFSHLEPFFNVEAY